MNRHDKIFNQDSDNDIQVEYRNLKMTEIPDLWDEIEGNLAPREVKKNKPKRTWLMTPPKRLAAIMAVVILAMLAMPVLRINIQKNNENDTSKSAMDKAEDKIVEDTPQESISQEMDAGSAPQDAEQDTSPNDSSEQAKSTEMQEDTSNSVEVQIQILSVTKQEQDWLLTAEVLEDARGFWEIGAVLTISCDDKEIEHVSLKGILQVRLQELQGKIKIVEVLP